MFKNDIYDELPHQYSTGQQFNSLLPIQTNITKMIESRFGINGKSSVVHEQGESCLVLQHGLIL